MNEQLDEYFEKQKLQIVLFPDKTPHKISTLKDFQEFMKKEYIFWGNCTNGGANQIRSHFQGISNNIDAAISQQNNFNAAKANIDSAINNARVNGYPAVYSSSPTAQFIKEQYSVAYKAADGACDYFFSNRLNQSELTDRNYFAGYINSLIFSGGFQKAFGSDIENEKKALEQLRSDFVKERNDLHDGYLMAEEKISKDHEAFKTDMSTWKSEIQGDTASFLKEKTDTLIELEKLYKEKLKLSAPAEYWKDLADEYSKKGSRWRHWAVGSSGLFIGFLAFVLYDLPAKWLNQNIEGLKATIILALIVSTGFYIIRLFVKLSLSAYHLSRDAREREQLTYIYLSLIDKKGATDMERSIVLQSLFSRADTGLLKGDSSPTLPDGLLGQVNKHMREGH